VNLFLAFILASVASYIAGYGARAALRGLGVMDRPNSRSSHDRPIMRGGGLSVLFAAAVVGLLFAPLRDVHGIYWVALAGLVLAAVSFLDDLRSVPRMLRLGVHAGAAITALFAVGLTGPAAIHAPPAPFLAAAGFLWITGYTNAFNFMDGIDGLAGMQVVTTGVGTALVALAAGASRENPQVILAVVLAGAGAGFLPHNFPRARMFLGDVGSASLGFFLAVLAFGLARELGWWLLGAFALLHANFVLDTAITLGRRIIRRERWLDPHREHFYQRLVRSGKSHRFVTGCEGLLQIAVLGIVMAAMHSGWAGRFAAAGTVCLVWAAFFSYCEARFRRNARGGH
jgi:UDP-N-acetylmuramyl pentapeptide phosphotransferase/UDP-N-acetylglucosamine-1-phosphate transferase